MVLSARKGHDLIERIGEEGVRTDEGWRTFIMQAQEECHAMAARADRGRDRRQLGPDRPPHLRRELDQLPQLRADPRDPTQRAHAQPIQLERLRPAQWRRQDLSPLSAGKHVLQHELDPARPGMLLLHRTRPRTISSPMRTPGGQTVLHPGSPGNGRGAPRRRR